MVKGYIDEINPITNINNIFYCTVKIGIKLPITTEELLRKILKYHNYYINGGIIIEIDDINQLDFINELINKCKMVNLNVIIDSKIKLPKELMCYSKKD